MECALLMLSLRGPLGPWQSPGTIYRTAPQKQAMVPGDCRVASLLAMTRWPPHLRIRAAAAICRRKREENVSYSWSWMGGNNSNCNKYCSNSLLRYSLDAKASASGTPGRKSSQAAVSGRFRLAGKQVQCPQYTRKSLRLFKA